MAFTVGVVLVLLLAGASLSGVHAGGHGLVAPLLAWALGAAWLAETVARGAGAGVAWWLAGACAAVCAVGLAVALPALGYRSMGPRSGPPALVGMQGRAVTDLDPGGVVNVRGESWSARSVGGPVRAGSSVRVASVDGVRLWVWTEEGD